MPNMPLDVSDAIELAELPDHDYLAPSLARYLGIDVEGHGPESLADDFNRFRFLLGATDGEGVFTPDEP